MSAKNSSKASKVETDQDIEESEKLSPPKLALGYSAEPSGKKISVERKQISNSAESTR